MFDFPYKKSTQKMCAMLKQNKKNPHKNADKFSILDKQQYITNCHESQDVYILISSPYAKI